MRPLLFDKYEGLGNDFIVVEAATSSLTTDAVRALCDRHRGIGADGVLFTGVSAGRAFMHVVNADGSTAEMCGNGLRCVALHLVRRGLVEDRTFEVDTDSGPHPVQVHEVASPGRVEIAMGVPSFSPSDIPLAQGGPLVDSVLRSDDLDIAVTAVSMGNPHAVTFDERAFERRTSFGPRIQAEPLFVRQANVGFARSLGPGRLELHVYERGSGWTEACGTGACAAAVAAVVTGRQPGGEAIDVRLPGGSLTIVVGEPGERVRMTGPARHVYSGRVEL